LSLDLGFILMALPRPELRFRCLPSQKAYKLRSQCFLRLRVGTLRTWRKVVDPVDAVAGVDVGVDGESLCECGDGFEDGFREGGFSGA